MVGQETCQHWGNGDASNVQQRQAPQEVVRGSVGFGLHRDGSQNADIAPVYDYIGKEEDSEKGWVAIFCWAKKDELNDTWPVPSATVDSDSGRKLEPAKGGKRHTVELNFV